MVFSIPTVGFVGIPIETYHVLLHVYVIDIIGNRGKIVVYDVNAVYQKECWMYYFLCLC